jgi:hypothetical protein
MSIPFITIFSFCPSLPKLRPFHGGRLLCLLNSKQRSWKVSIFSDAEVPAVTQLDRYSREMRNSSVRHFVRSVVSVVLQIALYGRAANFRFRFSKQKYIVLINDSV